MVRFRISNLARRPALAAVVRYGFAFASVAAALGLSLILVHYRLPRLFGTFSFAAIALVFWYCGTGPGLLTVLLSSLTFSFFLFPITEVRGPGWQSFLAIYAMFGGLVGWFSASRRRAERLLAEERDSLEKRVGERTRELARANEELRITEDALRCSEDHLRLVIDTVPALIHTGGPDGYLDYFNRRWLEYVGLPLEGLLGWNWTAVNHPDDVGGLVEGWREAIAAGKPFEHESRLRRADGEYRWMIHHKVPLCDECGNIVKWYGSSVDIEDRKRAEEGLHSAINERARLSAVRAEIGMALARKGDLREVLQACAEALVQHLDVAFARIWTLSSEGIDLELQASAGMYTHLDGRYSRIPLGDFKIARIAEERKAHLTNDVQSDPQIKDKDWARAEKITSFAGYPLVVEGRTVGVMGMFSQKPIPESTLDTLSFLVDGIAQGIDRKRAEEALRQSEQLYSKLVNSVDCIVWEADAKTLQFSFVSPQAERMLGYPAEQWLVAGFWEEHLHPDDRAQCAALCKQGTQEGRDHRLEYRMVAADGQTVWLHDVVSVHVGQEGPSRLTGVMIDVTRRKLAEMAAKESGDRFRLVFERSTAGMLICDSSEKIIRANKSFCDFLSYSEDELRGRSILDITYPEDAAKTVAYLEESRQHKPPSYDLEKRYVRKSGEVAWGRASSVFLLPEGRPPCWVAVVLDISERKRAEEALRNSEERWRAVFENSAVGIALTDPQGTYLGSNRAYQEMVGYTDQELRALSYIDITYAEDREVNRRLVIELVEGKRQHFSLEKRYRRKDGTLIWARVTVSEAHDTDGQFQFAMAVVEDITERKRAVEALRDSEERFRTIFDNAGIGIAQMDLKGHPVKTNAALQQMLGYSEADIGRMVFTEFTYPDDRQLDFKLYGEVVAGKREGYEIEKRYLKRDGGVVWGQLVVSLVKDPHRRPLYCVGMVEDITERKHAEGALRDSEERYRTLFERNMAGVYRTTMDGRILECNQAMANILGFDSPQEAKESRGQDNYFSEYERTQLIEKLEATGTLTNFEVRRRRKDGSPIWLLANLSLITPASGGPKIIEGTFVDITERKWQEEQLQESRNKLRALAAHLQRIREEERTRVAREIHDELGQALTAIKIDLSSLISKMPAEVHVKSESILKLVDETIQSVRRIATELRPVVLDELGLVAAVEWASEEFQARTGIKCRTGLPPDDVNFDPERATALFRIFQETLTNVARHANATEANVRLTKEGGDLILEVHDNGTGASKEQLSAPSSLGILGMRERALLLGGELTIASTPAEGTSVRVRIPETNTILTKEGKR